MNGSQGKTPSVLILCMQHSGGGAEKQSIMVAEALKATFEVTLVVAKPIPKDWQQQME